MHRRPTTTRRAVAALLAAALAALLLGCADEPGEGPLPVGPDGRRAEAAIEETGELPNGTRWRLRAPEPQAWNGTLLLYSRGSVPPDEESAALDAPDETTAQLLLDQGFAMVGSSYERSGWVLDSAVEDQHRLIEVARQELGTPQRTVAWGHSLGGLVTVALAEQHPDDIDGALAACGIVGGPAALWDPYLDITFVLRTLLLDADERVQLTGSTTPPRLALEQLRDAGTEALRTPAGAARVALAAAVGGVPTTVDPQASPTLDDVVAEVTAQVANLAFIVPMSTVFRAHMESRVGGNPSSNVDVDYAALLAASPTRHLVAAAYDHAGLDLTADLARLAAAPRIEADPGARARLTAPVTAERPLEVPVLALHGTADGLALPFHPRELADRAAAAGSGDLVRLAAVARIGHCSFTAAEQVAALAALLERVDHGAWPDLAPGALNAAATAFGPDANVQTAPDGTATPQPPAFVAPSFPPQPRRAAGLG